VNLYERGLQRVAACCSVLQCVTVCCSVLQCVVECEIPLLLERGISCMRGEIRLFRNVSRKSARYMT